VAGPEDSTLEVVMRMPGQPKIFRHEIESQPGTTVFEYGIRMTGDLDSLVEAEMARMRAFQRGLEEQDSLLKTGRRSPAGYPYSADTVSSRRKF